MLPSSRHWKDFVCGSITKLCIFFMLRNSLVGREDESQAHKIINTLPLAAFCFQEKQLG